MPIEEPQVARELMELAKQDYDRTMRLRRAGKRTDKHVERARREWNVAMTNYNESLRRWSEIKRVWDLEKGL